MAFENYIIIVIEVFSMLLTHNQKIIGNRPINSLEKKLLRNTAGHWRRRGGEHSYSSIIIEIGVAYFEWLNIVLLR